MKRLSSIFLSPVLVLLPVAALAQSEDGAAAPAGFETNLNRESITYEGNDFEIRDDGLYTKLTTNTVFARSDKIVDGTVSFTMEYEVDILSVTNNDYARGEGRLYYTFGLGLPEGDGSAINDSVKGVLFYRSGVTIMPKTREGTYVIANTESALPDEPTDASEVTEAVPAETEQPASDVPAATDGEKKGDNKSGNPALWIILSVAAVIVVAPIIVPLLKKKKGAGDK